ncbi:ABC transporter ATP-binding protein [bacterium]|nr:ABC transporter ATP-binding protein [bacterium]MBT6293453.1 ABC transporter ATP-binding protein [bacterium]
MFKKLFSQVEGTPSLNPYKLAFESSRFSKKYFWLAFVTMFLSLLFMNLSPFVVERLFDSLELMNFDDIYFYAGISILFLFLDHFFDYFYGIYATYLYGRIVYQSRVDILNYINQHGDDFFARRPSGEISSEILDSGGVSTLVFGHIETTLPNAITLIVSFVLFFKVNLYIGLFALMFYGSLFVFIKRLLAKFSNLSKIHAKKKHKYYGVLSDFVGNIKVPKIFNVLRVQSKRIYKNLQIIRDSGFKKWNAADSMWITIDFSDFFLRLFAAIGLGYFYFNNVITLGEFTMVFYLIGRMDGVVDNLQKVFEEFSEKEAEVRLALSKLITPIEEADKVDAKKLKVKGLPGIEFKNVEFAYENVSKKQLNKFNLIVKPGEKIGVVGESGAGKSTVFKVLLKQYSYQKGEILINGQEIADCTKDSVRKQIAVVSQDTLVFNRSLKENITLGVKYSDKVLKKALKDSHCAEFIKNLPNGLDTQVGERGVKLSGGQRQRIGIARALLKASPIILLDEATSALDSKSENFIQDSIQKLSSNHTMMCIAHRLSTLSFMDRIIVLEKGKVVEEGTHKELLKLKGKYFELWSHQNKGML